MVVVRGVNVFPSQIEKMLTEIEGTEPRFELIVDRSEGVPEKLELHVEMSPNIFIDEVRKLMQLEENIREAFESRLGVPVQVKLVEPRSIHAKREVKDIG
jgi:phenylacetate-CoA ligase